MKKRPKTLTPEEKKKTLDMLYTAASSVRGRADTKMFLRDLLTESERIMLGRRIWIARMLLAGESYRDIAYKLKVGHGTISTVDHWLEDQCPGYETAIRSLEKEMDRRAVHAEARVEPFSYAAMKKKYPLHFLFFPEPKPKKKYRS